MAEADRPFELVLARSGGRIVQVRADQSAVEALEAAGIEVLTSCREGVCGTCVTPVLEGTPEHRDLFLTVDEQDSNRCFTPCCSRASSPRLVLDL
jgi:vanillate monooxygenase ferredoxin subunit